MTIPTWQISGQYYETCNCDFVCPCLPGGMTVSPSKESCNFAMAFEVERGTYDTVSLDGLGFIVLGSRRKRWRRQLVRRAHRRRAGKRRATRRDHGHRERDRGWADVDVRPDWEVRGRAAGTHPLRPHPA